MADVNIKVSVDTGNSVQGLNNVQKELAETAITASKADSSLRKMGVGANQAQNAMINLGRVVQDAPYGFIGIANNINPLLESFQRLKAETGSTGSALKTLLSSLGGAGGLGLAVSLGSAALSLFGMAMQRSGTETKKAKDENEDYAKSVRAITDGIAKEYVAITEIVEQLKQENLSRGQRVEAIKQLIDKAPEYFGTLDKEKATIQQITQAYDFYAASILRAVQAKVLEKQLEDVVSQRLELQRKQVEFVTKQVDENGKLKTTVQSIYDTEVQGESEYQRLQKGRGALTKEQNLQLKNLLLTEKLIIDELSKIKPIDFKPVVEKVAKDAKDIKPIEIPYIFVNVRNRTSGEISQDDKDAAKKQAQEQQAAIQETLKRFPIKIPFKLDLSPNALAVEIDRINTELGKMVKELRNGSLASIGESIGASLSTGTNVIQGAFQSLFKVIGAGLEQLGEAMIGLGTAKEAIEKFNLVPGIGTVIAGIATIALGAILKNIKLPGFADGVTNFGGGMAIVGERGPELVRLPRGSDVIPNHLIGDVGMGQQIYIPAITLRGQDLVLAFNRASATLNRNG